MLVRYFLSSLLLCVSLFAYSQTPSDDLLARLQHIKSLSADFTQRPLGKPQRLQAVSTGHMQLVRPGKFRWLIKAPSKQLVVTDGKTLWYYNIDLEQVTVQSLVKQQDSTPAELLSGATAKVLQAYTVTRISVGNATRFSLQPNNKQAQFKQVILRFTHNTLVSMSLTDKLDQRSQIDFTHIQQNQAISPTLFSFSPPASADVIQK